MIATDDRDRGLPLYAQIANLEHRLAALREKRETFLRHGRMMKRVAWIAVALAPLLVIYVAVIAKSHPLPMVFLASILIAVAAALLWLYRHSTWISDPGPNNGMAYNRYTSYWLFIEETLKDGERHLAELKSQERAVDTADPRRGA